MILFEKIITSGDNVKDYDYSLLSCEINNAVGRYQYFEEICCLHFQGKRRKAARSSGMLVHS
jgi:hypothetical protein